MESVRARVEVAEERMERLESSVEDSLAALRNDVRRRIDGATGGLLDRVKVLEALQAEARRAWAGAVDDLRTRVRAVELEAGRIDEALREPPAGPGLDEVQRSVSVLSAQVEALRARVSDADRRTEAAEKAAEATTPVSRAPVAGDGLQGEKPKARMVERAKAKRRGLFRRNRGPPEPEGASPVLSDIRIQAAPNRDPDAVGDSLTTPQGTAGTVNVLANDSDPDGDALTVSGWTNGAHGTVDSCAGGVCEYSPTAGYSGADSFTYTISDGQGGAATGSVAVTVLPAAGGRVSGNGAIAGTSLYKIVFTVDASGAGGSFGFTSRKVVFSATSVAHFARAGNQASFDGTATWNGLSGYSYDVAFVDNGTPGRKDTMSLVVRNPAGADVFTTGGPRNLAAGSGNVVIGG